MKTNKCQFSAQNIANLRVLLNKHLISEKLNLKTKKTILKKFDSTINAENIFFIYSFKIDFFTKFLILNRVNLLVEIRKQQLSNQNKKS